MGKIFDRPSVRNHKTPATALTITSIGGTKGGRTGNPRPLRRRGKPFGVTHG